MLRVRGFRGIDIEASTVASFVIILQERRDIVMDVSWGSVREYYGYLVLLCVETDHTLGSGILVSASEAGKEEEDRDLGG